MVPDQPKGSERRNHPRVDTKLRADIKLPDGRWLSSETIENISLGGIYMVISEELKFGTQVEIEFELPGAGAIRCGGTVVWTKAEEIPGSQKRPKPGIGIRLTRLGISEMRELESYIAGRIKGGK